jgi:hypothetical protein
MKYFESGNREELTAVVREKLEGLDKLEGEQGTFRDTLLRQLYDYIKSAGNEKFYHNQRWSWNVCVWLRIIFSLSQICFVGELGEQDCWAICAKKRPKMYLFYDGWVFID